MSRIFAIADTHLGGAVDKPMDIFGAAWERHTQRLEKRWRETVGEDDWVLIPGDVSWAMTLEEARVDLEFLAELPGRTVLIKGNHDYWWTSRAKVEGVLPDGMFLVQNDAFDLGGGIGVVGTRGWQPPDAPRAGENDAKIYQREVNRLALSLDAARGRFEHVIAMLHYPPHYVGFGPTDFVPLLEEAGVEVCLYGHLHGRDQRFAFEGEKNGVRYQFVAADYLEFRPAEVPL
ncbi:MAG: metallophosphoesterase [Planctomycetota bacterium]|jgi:predicted phosphohydrolase